VGVTETNSEPPLTSRDPIAPPQSSPPWFASSSAIWWSTFSTLSRQRRARHSSQTSSRPTRPPPTPSTLESSYACSAMGLQNCMATMAWAWYPQDSKVSLCLWPNSPVYPCSSLATVNYWSPSTSTAIIRCPRDHYEMVWAALTYITHLPKPLHLPVVIRVVRVSGTIRKAEEEVIRRSQQIIKRAKTWEGKGDLPMLQSVEKAAEKERREDEVLARVDQGSDEEEMSE
jgi:hypothetical protein